MNYSATSFSHRDSVIAFLIAGLSDQSRWVRMGATQSLARNYPNEARELLNRLWDQVAPNSTEQFALALALEICGDDTVPLLAPLLRVDNEELTKVLGLDAEDRLNAHDNWVNFLNARREFLPRGAVRLVNEIRPIRLWRANAQTFEPPQESQQNRYEIVADHGEFELRQVNAWLHNEEFRANSHAIFEPILASLRSQEKDQIQDAIQSLLKLTLCEPNDWYHWISSAFLVALGEEAGNLLLPSLWNNPPVIPTWEQLREFASRAERPWDYGDLPPGAPVVEIASFLATKSLANFRDKETVSNLVRVAVEGVAKAERTLAQMPIEVSLPYLFWAANNNADWVERQRASTIIWKIITKHPGYGIDYHYVDRQKIEVDLGWITELLSRSSSVPEWANEPDVGGTLSWIKNERATNLLLRNAISMIPLIQGTRKVLYYTLRAWDTFINFSREFLSLTESTDTTSPQVLTVRRYMVCEFPKECILEEPAQLTVRLDVSRPEDNAPVSEIALELGPTERKVDLLVLIKAPGFQIDDYYSRLRVPLTESSSEVEFTLIPKSLGPQSIEIELLRGVERVGYSALTVNVVAEGVQAGHADVTVLEGTGNRDLLSRGETKARIQIDWNKDDGTLSYQLIDPSMGTEEPQDLGTAKTKIHESHVQNWLATQSKIIKEYLQDDYETENDFQGALLGLAAIGNELFDQLAPTRLLKFVQRWPERSVIAIESNENWIPWELLAASSNGPMLGERFQLIRTPRTPAGEILDSAEIVPVGVRENPCAEIRKITSVVGDGIRRGNQPGDYSAKRTFGQALALVEDLIERTFPEFQKAVRYADIVHFTCHGRGEPYYYLSLGTGPGKRFLIGQVKDLVLNPGVVVFANACSSDKAELFLGEFQNFGWSFYKRGVRPFIGTLGPVPANHAIAFAEYFYKGFIQDGISVGQALQRARLNVATEFRNPFYLFYCLYGSASICRRIPRKEFEG